MVYVVDDYPSLRFLKIQNQQTDPHKVEAKKATYLVQTPTLEPPQDHQHFGICSNMKDSRVASSHFRSFTAQATPAYNKGIGPLEQTSRCAHFAVERPDPSVPRRRYFD